MPTCGADTLRGRPHKLAQALDPNFLPDFARPGLRISLSPRAPGKIAPKGIALAKKKISIFPANGVQNAILLVQTTIFERFFFSKIFDFSPKSRLFAQF